MSKKNQSRPSTATDVEEIVEREADSLDEAKRVARSQIPAGSYLRSETVLCDGKSETVRHAAATLDEAHAKVQRELPSGVAVRETREIPAGYTSVEVEAFSDAEASEAAFRTLRPGSRVESLRQLSPPTTRFFGIVRKPGQFLAECWCPALVEITYARKAKVRLTIGPDPWPIPDDTGDATILRIGLESEWRGICERLLKVGIDIRKVGREMKYRQHVGYPQLDPDYQRHAALRRTALCDRCQKKLWFGSTTYAVYADARQGTHAGKLFVTSRRINDGQALGAILLCADCADEVFSWDVWGDACERTLWFDEADAYSDRVKDERREIINFSVVLSAKRRGIKDKDRAAHEAADIGKLWWYSEEAAVIKLLYGRMGDPAELDNPLI